MEDNKKLNMKKVCLTILFFVVLIIIIVFIFRNNKKVDNKVLNNNVETNQILNNIQESNNEDKNNIEDENTINNIPEEKVIDKNNLSETEGSFGKLEIPVYKKSEKDIKLPLLIYHAFQTPEPADDKYKLFSTQERFEENVKTLLDAGYTFLTLEDIYKYNNETLAIPEKNITITMDDGWLGCYTEAFNVLKKYNIPATIFIVENLVGTEGYFTWEQAKEMYDSGLVKIHVHGRKHINATDYASKETLVADYNHTHELIEEKLGTKVQKIMAYPAGKSSENTINWLKEAGFEIQVQTKYGTVNKSNSLDLTGLGRIRGEQATGKSILTTIENK